jgi:hypothetical protein
MRAEAHAIQVASELRTAVGTIAEAVAHASELAFSDADGRLRTMSDRHGRPEGDLRPSMVAGARRMPARR